MNRGIIFTILGLFFSLTAEAGFTFLNTHPEASTVFPNNKGVKEMTLYGDRLYMGYGQNEALSNETVCPSDDLYILGTRVFCDIKLRYLDPLNGQISPEQAEMRTQGMFAIKEHSGNLYVLPDDPDTNVMLLRCNSSSCSNGFFQTAERSAHNYVSVEYQGNLYIAGGADSGDGAIWKSTDNGLTWNIDKLVPKLNSSDPCCARVTFMEVFEGSLYAQAYQFSFPQFEPQSVVYKLTGNTWTTFNAEVLPFAATARSSVFANKMIYTVGTRLRLFDGASDSVEISSAVRDFFIKDEFLYVLETSGRVLQTTNLSSWQPVENHSVSARQIAVSGDTMFLADDAGNLWVSDKIFPRPTLSFFPAIYHLIED